MMMRTAVFAAVLSLCLATGEAFAAEGGTGVEANKKSISFALPSGGNGYVSGAIAPWMMISPTLNLGMNVGLALGTKPDTNFDVLLGPAVRYYLDTAGKVLPYVHGQLNLRIHSDGNDATDEDPELSVAGGMGVEWFVTSVFSLAGHVGLGIDILRQGGSNAGQRFGTFTSGLTGQIYF